MHGNINRIRYRGLLLLCSVLVSTSVNADSTTVKVNNQTAVTKIYTIYRANPANHSDRQSVVNWNIPGGQSTQGSVSFSAPYTDIGVIEWNAMSYTAYKAAVSGGLTEFTDNGTGGEPAGPWKYHWDVCNDSPYRRTFKISKTNGTVLANIDLQPGDCSTGDITLPEGTPKEDLIITGTQYGDDENPTFAVDTIGTDDPGWYQDGPPPDTDSVHDDGTGTVPPDTHSKDSTKITFDLNTSDLAKEKTLQTTANVLHNDLVQGFQGVHGGLNGVNNKLAALSTSMSSIQNAISSQTSTLGSKIDGVGAGISGLNTTMQGVNTSLGSINNNISAQGVKLDAINTSVGTVANNVSAMNSNLGGKIDAFKGENNQNHQLEQGRLVEIRDGIYQVISNTAHDSLSGSTIKSMAEELAESHVNAIKGPYNNLAESAAGFGGDRHLPSMGGLNLYASAPAFGFALDLDVFHNSQIMAIASAIRTIMLWVVILLFFRAAYEYAHHALQFALITPQATSNMGALGGTGVALLMAAAIAAAVLVVVTFLVVSIIFSGWWTTLLTNPLQSANTYVSYGLNLLDAFIPVTSIIATTASYYVFKFSFTGLVYGCQILIRFFVG